MSFTEATLQAQLSYPAQIVRYTPVSTTHTDVTVQNANTTSRKTGSLQIAQTNSATEAAALVLAALSA